MLSWKIAAAFLLIGMACAQSQTLNRAQVKQMSSKELAARVLNDIAETSTAKELKFYISPVAPTPPWLERIAIDLPRKFRSDIPMCVASRVTASFAPQDPDARKHLLDAQYDPSTHMVSVGTENRYAKASKPDCEQLPEADYFEAASENEALAAIRAFDLFRANTDKAKCVDRTGENRCREVHPKDVTAFSRVMACLDDTQSDGTILRTIVLGLPRDSAYERRELWIHLRLNQNGTALRTTEMRILHGGPVL